MTLSYALRRHTTCDYKFTRIWHTNTKSQARNNYNRVSIDQCHDFAIKIYHCFGHKYMTSFGIILFNKLKIGQSETFWFGFHTYNNKCNSSAREKIKTSLFLEIFILYIPSHVLICINVQFNVCGVHMTNRNVNVIIVNNIHISCNVTVLCWRSSLLQTNIRYYNRW